MGSRFTHPAESRYAPVEGDALGVPGVINKTSDALSRHPSGTLTPARLHLPDDSTATDVSCHRIPTNLLAGISIAPPAGVDDSEDDDSGLAIALSAAITDIPLNWEAIQVATAADGPLQ